MAEANSMDYLKFIVTQMTNVFVHLFQVGTCTVSEWDTDVCIDSIVHHVHLSVADASYR